jgi:hypothetical protein
MLFSLNSLSTSPDSAAYLNAAFDIVNHKPTNQLSPGLFERRPLFPILIASSFWLFGISIRNALLITRLFFLLNTMSVFFIGKRLFNKWVGLFASLFLLTSLAYNEWSSLLLIDNILPFFLIWYFFFIYLGMEKGSIKYFILAALLLMSSLFLKEGTIAFIYFPFFSIIFTIVFTRDFRAKKALKLLTVTVIVLFIAYVLWASAIFLISGHVYSPLGAAVNLKHIKISKILTDNVSIIYMLSDKGGNLSVLNLFNNLYNFYIKFISSNFPILIEFLFLLGWGFSLYRTFRKNMPDILLSMFFLMSIPIMAFVGNPASPGRFGDVLFLLCFSSLVIGKLIYEIIKKILLASKNIEILKPKFISPILVALIIILIFGTQISQSWDFYRTRVSLFTGNWGFTVDFFHNSAVENMSIWISNNVLENSKILTSVWWGESFYFLTKGKYPLSLLKISSHKGPNYFFNRDKLLFFDYRQDFHSLNFQSIREEDLLYSLKKTSAQYILITSPDNSLLNYLDDNDYFKKLHEIQMYPNPGWIKLYKVLDIKPKTGYQGVINRGMMNWLKNLNQADKNGFDEIKEKILKKGLSWSDEDIERRIIRERPSHFLNLKMNNKVELAGYDLIPITQYRFELIENEKIKKNNEVSFEKIEGSGKKELSKEDLLLKLGEKFEIIFYWKCLEKIEHRYALWAGLDRGYDSIELGHILVDESEYPTTEWKPGELIKEICQFRVPDYIEPGEYEFKINLYNINEREKASPSFVVGEVKIQPPLKGAINRLYVYDKVGYRIESLIEYIEIIKHIDSISNPENKKLLLHALKKLESYKTKILEPQGVNIDYVMGFGYEKLGNLEKAEEILKNVLKKDKNHADALFQLGKIFYLEKRYKSAADILDYVPLDQENNFEAGLILKEIYQKIGPTIKLTEIDRKLRIASENHFKKSQWNVVGIKSSNPILPWANVNIGKKVIIYGDYNKLSLKIKGEKAGNVLPFLVVWIDNKLLFEGYLKNEEWNDYKFSIKDIEPGLHLLKIWKRGGGPLYLGQLNLL